MKVAVGWGVLLGLVFSAGSRGDDSNKVQEERKALNGKWICQSSEVNGIKRDGKASQDQAITFAGQKVIQTDAATREILTGTYQLDLSGNQESMTLKQKVGSKDVIVRYIFERDGDKLRMCGHLLPGYPLPKEFTAPAGSKRVYLVWKRAKE